MRGLKPGLPGRMRAASLIFEGCKKGKRSAARAAKRSCSAAIASFRPPPSAQHVPIYHEICELLSDYKQSMCQSTTESWSSIEQKRCLMSGCPPAAHKQAKSKQHQVMCRSEPSNKSSCDLLVACSISRCSGSVARPKGCSWTWTSTCFPAL